MIELFKAVEFYLVVSFLFTVGLLGKLGWKSLLKFLDNETKEIKSKLDSIDQQKKESNAILSDKREELETFKEGVSKALDEARQKSKEFEESSIKKLDQVLKDRQKEYDIIVEKVRGGLSADLKNRMINEVVRDLENKIRTREDSREFQNQMIDQSMDDFEKLLDSGDTSWSKL